MAEREVHFGQKVHFYPLATHWALKVGDTWYEVCCVVSESKVEKNEVFTTKGEISAGGAELGGALPTMLPTATPHPLAHGGPAKYVLDKLTAPLRSASCLGTTKRTDAQIAEFNEDYLEDHPFYCLLTDNCQTYATALFEFLMDDGTRNGNWLVGNRLPWQDSPFS